MSELVTRAFHASGEGGYIFDSRTGARFYVHELKLQNAFHKLTLDAEPSPAGPCYIAEVISYNFAVHRHRVWWMLNRAQCCVCGGDRQGKRLGQNFARLKDYMVDSGFSGIHARKSRAAMEQGLKRKLGEDEMLEAAAEFSATTVGLMAVLTTWSTDHRASSDLHKSRALGFIKALANRFVAAVTGFSFKVSYTDGIFCFMRVTISNAGDVRLRNLGNTNTVLESFIRAVGDVATLGDLCVTLVKLFKSKRKHIGSIAKQVFHDVVQLIDNVVECSVDDELWARESMLGLPVMTAKTGRARRLSLGFVTAYVGDSVHVRTPRVLATVERVIQLRSSSSLGTFLKASSAAKLSQRVMLQYWANMRYTFGGSKHISVSLDGVRLCGEDMVFGALYSMDKGLAAWATPKVNTQPRRHNAATLGVATLASR